MAEKERNKKQFHAIIKEVRKTSEIYKFNSQDQRGMKGWKKEWDSNRMPDRQKKKKSLEITLLIHGERIWQRVISEALTTCLCNYPWNIQNRAFS